MPEGVGYGPQNTASVGKGLNIIGRYAYAYSGGISTNNNETDLLDFETGSEVLDSVVYCGTLTSTDDFRFVIYINGEASFFVQILASANYGMPRNATMPMVLPPFSNVRITAQNTTDTTAHDACATVTGKIYK